MKMVQKGLHNLRSGEVVLANLACVTGADLADIDETNFVLLP